VRAKPRPTNSLSTADRGRRISNLRPSARGEFHIITGRGRGEDVGKRHPRHFGAVADVEGRRAWRWNNLYLAEQVLDQRKSRQEHHISKAILTQLIEELRPISDMIVPAQCPIGENPKGDETADMGQVNKIHGIWTASHQRGLTPNGATREASQTIQKDHSSESQLDPSQISGSSGLIRGSRSCS